MDREKHRVLTILMMRFGLSAYAAIPLIKNWLSNHPNKSWHDLSKFVLEGKVIFKNGILHDVTRGEIRALTNQMRGDRGVEIKNRWYSLKLYPQCFVGSDAVDWFVNTQKVGREEAIQLGQMLVARKIIHHVHDDHNFKDEYLFYRFYQDETQAKKENYTQNQAWGDVALDL